MKWSWKIGRLWGIDIYMHVTFLFIVGWLAVSYWFCFCASCCMNMGMP
jgi:hypothetical protein